MAEADSKAEPFFTDTERRDPLWQKLKKHMQGRIDAHRILNDGNHNAEATAKLRGRLAELKYLVDLDIPVQHVQAETGD